MTEYQRLRGLFISWTPEWRTERLAQASGTSALVPAGFARGWPWPLRYATQAVATTWHVVRTRPDFVTFQNPPALTGLLLVLLGRVLRFDVWADCHSGPWLDPRWVRFRRLNDWVLARCAGALFHNPQLMADAGGAVPTAVLSWTPPLEDLSDAAALAAADAYVVMVCSYHPDEPTDEVFAAARELPDVRFKLTGKAPPEFVDRAPGNVEFTGFLPTDDYWRLLQSARAVICLTKYPNTMQQGIAEALEAGVPGVSVDTATMRDWRDGSDTSTLIDWQQPADIARGVRWALDQAGAYDSLGRERLLQRSHDQFAAFAEAVAASRQAALNS